MPQRQGRLHMRRDDPRAVLRDSAKPAMPGTYYINVPALINGRQRRSWRQIDLGRHLGLSQQTISEVERGLRVMNEYQARRLAEVLFGDGERWHELTGPEVLSVSERERDQAWHVATYGARQAS